MRVQILTIAATAVVVLLAVFLLPRLFGYRPYMVVSASMKQSFPVGSLIFVTDATPEEIEVGDPITFSSGTLTITHRVIAIDSEKRQFTTKGDNNRSSEWVSFDDLQGKALDFAIPYMGYFAAWFITTQGRIITLIVILSTFLLGMTLGKLGELDDEESGEENKDQKGETTEIPADTSAEVPTEEPVEKPAEVPPEESLKGSLGTVSVDEAVTIINEELEGKEGEINEQNT